MASNASAIGQSEGKKNMRRKIV